jgi:DNA modification methylase
MELYKQVNGIALYQGDARNLDALEDESVFVVITSPPYNVGVECDVWNDSMSVNATAHRPRPK